MNIQEKKQFVENLKADLNDSQIILVAHYAGLTVEQVNSLRLAANENDVKVKVAKNSLAKLAVEGTEFDNLKDQLSGPTMLVFSKDVASASKLLVDFAKKNEELVLQAGSYSDSVLGKEDIITLSKLPSLDEIRAKLISLIQTPATRVACVLQAPASQAARVVKAYAEK